MRARDILIASGAAICLLWAGALESRADAPTAFTYQGQLKENGSPVTGTADFRFGLWDAEAGGMEVSYALVYDVPVDHGLFTAEVDFGPDMFDGSERWIDIQVAFPAGGSFTPLAGRQSVTPAPYALYALNGGGGGDCLWELSGSDIYYTAGNVGVGNPSPWAKLDVLASGEDPAVFAENKDSGTSATLVGTSAGVSGYTTSPDGAGVYGSSWAGAGVWGHNGNPDGYAGMFTGRGYFQDEVGIGRIPTAKLDVAGTLKTDGFQLTDTPVAGYVLTCDASGVGTWQAAGGASLWTADPNNGISYQSGNVGIGTCSMPNTRLFVDDAATYTISAHNGSTSGNTFAVYAEADSTLARAVFADATATSGETVGVFGRSHSPDGFGVWGTNDATTGYNTAIGVFGSTSSPNGIGVKGWAPGNGGCALWGRADGTSGSALLAEAVAQSGTTYGVNAYAASPSGYAVYAFNEADSGNATAVYGETASPDGFGGYFDGKGYFSGNVGIGTTTPASPLTVTGLIESTSGGFKFPDGTTQTTAATGGSLWQQVGSEIYYDAGNVGVGVSDPHTTLHVAGGNWDVATTEGDFKIGTATYRLKMGVATAGGGAGTCRIFAGGPSSKLVLGASAQDRLTVTSTNVGIGTLNPIAELDVVGTVRTDGFQLDTAPQAGYVLTCDASGVGTWQQATGGLTLPYEGSVSSSSSAFKITNTGTSPGTVAIHGRISNPSSSSDACAGYFDATDSNGYALYALADSTAVSARCAGTGGTAFYGNSSGSGGARFRCSADNGYGVKGEASATSGSDTVGGWFESGSSTGKGVYAYTDGDYAVSVWAEADGGESEAIHAESPWTGIYAKGYNAAKFYGDVRVYEYGTANQVFHVDDDSGVTSVDVLQIMGGSDLAEKFDVSEQAEPGMVVEIDPDNPGKLRVARGAYNRRVAGVVSGANKLEVGMMLADLSGAESSQPIALSGRVWVYCDASHKAVEPGDLLTTAERPGHAMPVTDYDRAHGAVIGKAMTPLAQGETGLVLVLVNLQ